MKLVLRAGPIALCLSSPCVPHSWDSWHSSTPKFFLFQAPRGSEILSTLSASQLRLSARLLVSCAASAAGTNHHGKRMQHSESGWRQCLPLPLGHDRSSSDGFSKWYSQFFITHFIEPHLVSIYRTLLIPYLFYRALLILRRSTVNYELFHHNGRVRSFTFQMESMNIPYLVFHTESLDGRQLYKRGKK